jgi:superfamily I DNA/RNA helicase
MEEDTGKRPRFIVGTIHSVKGGEADHVWIDTELPPLILSEMQKDIRASYDEARVAYVAVTRARKTVGLLRSRMRNPMLRL